MLDACARRPPRSSVLLTQRGWDATAYVDEGVSGSKDRRPALDRLMADARAGRLDLVAVWRFDRFARNTAHLLAAMDEFRAHRRSMSKHDEAKQSFLDEGLLILSLAQEAPALFEQATREEKRELLNHHLSNSSWAGGKLTIEWRKPYVFLAEFQNPESDEPPSGSDSEGGPSEMVGETGFEPATLGSQNRCATRLRYSPTM